MINVSDGFKNEVFVNDNRIYQYDIRITFSDSSYIDLDNSNLLEQGGVVVDEAVSSDEKLTVGSCIVNKLTLNLWNYDGEFDAYSFEKANVVLKIGLLVNGQIEKIQRGIYIVSEPPIYNGSSITLTCYDYMTLTDIPYSDVATTYPATISTIINGICTACGVERVVQNLPNDSMTIATSPATDTMTCREMLGYISQINCVNCRFNNMGKMEFIWFSDGFSSSITEVRQLQDGAVRSVADNVVRVTYQQNSGSVAWVNQVPIPAVYTLDIAKYDTVITGVRLVVMSTSDADVGAVNTYETGTDDYLISIENNPFVTAENADTILAVLASQLVGFRYRKATVTHVGMPWMVAGDSALVTDARGADRNIIVSSTVFTALDKQNTISASTAPVSAAVSQFSPETVQYVNQMGKIKPVIQTLNQRIANANGLYETRVTDQGATITYLHNKSLLAESDIQIQVSDVGVLVTADGTATTPTWYGLTVDGTMIANILQANGINADWIDTGALVIYDDDDNEIFRADKTNKTFRWNMAHSAMDDTGVLTLTDDGESLGGASLRVQSSDQYHTSHVHIYSDAIGMYKSGKTQTSLWPDEWNWADTSRDYGEPAVNLWSVFNLVPTDQSSGLTINNRTLEEWMYASHDYVTIAQNSNLDSYVSPGNYRCSAGTVAATLTNSPFTDTSFQLLVFRMDMITDGSANQCLQVAWQNKLTGFLKYRIRHNSGSWGSWRQIASAEDSCPIGTVIWSQAASSGTRAIPAGTSYTNLTSITLPAGTWAVTAHTSFNSVGDTKYRHVAIGTSASNSTYGAVQIAALAAGNTSIMTSRYVQLSSSTTLYLNVFSATACNAVLSGSIIEAVRLK